MVSGAEVGVGIQVANAVGRVVPWWRFAPLGRRVLRDKGLRITAYFEGFGSKHGMAIGPNYVSPRWRGLLPPRNTADWMNWSRAMGMKQAESTILRMHVRHSGSAATCVIGRPVLRVTRKPIPDGWVEVVSPGQGGGPLVVKRQYVVDLRPERMSIEYVGDDGDRVRSEESPQFHVLRDDPFEIEVVAQAQSGWYEWWLEFQVIVDGRRDIFRVDDRSKPFVLVGAEGLQRVIYYEGPGWQLLSE